MDQKYLTAKEVMNRLQLSRNVVYRLIQDGEIAAVKIGRNYRIAEEDFLNFIEREKEK